MGDQQIYTHQLPNGLTLLAESMEWLESAAFTLLVPCGCAFDPPQQEGLSNLVCDMVQRGAGDRDSRQFINDLENLGLDYASGVSNSHVSFGGATLAENIGQAISIFADVVQRPRLPSDQLDDSRMVCYQEVRTLEDDLARKMMLSLRRAHYPAPYGHSQYGTVESVSQIGLDDVQRHVKRHYSPRGAILGVAGKVQWGQLRELVEQRFGDWQAQPATEIEEQPATGGYVHSACDSSQTHVGIAYPSVPYSHDDYYRAWSAVSVLSDGMSSRFFTEVREKRGLCYSVDASYHALRGLASVQCYAGTSTDRAQQTLDVMLAELAKLAEGVRDAELARLKARCKSSLIMQQESSSARSSTIASQWYFLGRVRTLEEVGQKIDALTCDSINRYLADHPPGPYTIATLGAQKLETQLEVP